MNEDTIAELQALQVGAEMTAEAVADFERIYPHEPARNQALTVNLVEGLSDDTNEALRVARAHDDDLAEMALLTAHAKMAVAIARAGSLAEVAKAIRDFAETVGKLAPEEEGGE